MGDQIAVVRLAYVTTTAPTPRSVDSQRAPRSQVPSVSKVLTQGCLNNRREGGRRLLGSDITFHCLCEVIGNGYRSALHTGDYSTNW